MTDRPGSASDAAVSQDLDPSRLDLDLLVLGDSDAGLAATRQALQLGARVGLAISGASLLQTPLRRAIGRLLASGTSRTGGPVACGQELTALLGRARHLHRQRLMELHGQGAMLLEAPINVVEPGLVRAGGRILRTGSLLITSPASRPQLPGGEHAVEMVELLAGGPPPPRCLVIGDDVPALEVASWLAALGSRVTLLAAPALLEGVGPSVLQLLEEQAGPEHLGIHPGSLTGITREGHTRIVRWSHQGQSHERTVEQVVLARGAETGWRLPFELPAAGVHLAGEARGSRFGHEEEARLAARQALLGQRETAAPQLPTRVLFTLPEIAWVGQEMPPMGAAAAARGDAGPELVERSVELAELDHAGCGQLRLGFDRLHGQLVAARAWGPRAEELVDTALLALRNQMRCYDLAALPWSGTAFALIGEVARRAEQAWKGSEGAG